MLRFVRRVAGFGLLAALAGCGAGGGGNADVSTPSDVPDAVATPDLPDLPKALDAPADPDAAGDPGADLPGLACLLPPQAAAPDPEAPVALFSLAAAAPSTPFPLDLYTVPAALPGGRALAVGSDAATPVSAAVAFLSGFVGDVATADRMLGQVDGFATFGPIVFPFTAPPDPAAAVTDPPAATSGAVFLVAIDPVSGACGPRIPAFVDVEAVDAEGGVGGLVVVRPYLPLAPGIRHVAGVTRALAGADDRAAVAHPHFRAVTGVANVPDDLPRDRALAAAGTLDVLDACLASMDPPLCAGDLAVATVFTTRDGTAALRAARDGMAGQSALEPALDRDESDAVVAYAPGDLAGAFRTDDLSASSVAVQGRIRVPDYRDADGDVPLAAEGMPAPAAEPLEVPFVLLLPAARQDIPTPTRLVVMAHGHSGDKERIAHLARRFNEQGLALAAIDAMGHGALSGEGGFLTADLRVARGSFVQSDVNLIAFLEAVQGLHGLDVLPAGAPDGLPDLDLSPGIGFIGESLGALTGAPACALVPGVRAVVLNVGGGGLTNCAPDTVEGLLGGVDRQVYWQLKALLQALVDTFDPIAFAGLLAADDGPGARALLMQAVVGDSAFDGPPTADLARALGLTSVCPCPRDVPFLPAARAPFAGAGLFTYDDTAAHGFLLANTGNPAASDAVRRQAARFLRTALDGGPPRVEDFLDRE